MNEDLSFILDTMTGADGGKSFLLLKCFVEDMEGRSSNGDKGAKELLLIVTRFRKLIEVANKS